MAHHKSAIKRIRTSADARLRNRQNRSRFRSAEKRVMSTTEPAQAASELLNVYALLDRLAAKGILHKNTAARHKAKLARHVNTLQS